MARQEHSYENYEFLDLIGIGSFGSVHKAQNKNTNEIVKYMQLYLYFCRSKLSCLGCY